MTREEDLVRIAKKLDKMVSRNNMDGALDLLRELKGFNMTLKLLQQWNGTLFRIGMSAPRTRIGMSKHCTDGRASCQPRQDPHQELEKASGICPVSEGGETA
ncbi:hypothetical protein ANANG_G00026330 [Anguilla anguilla]|uniref:TFIIS N-terminal domain-containing protein n=1 Tax=Anguilla anguilla TaxID=7936 RepID=A0A9D3N2G3_ANGAN|nr:hypothetical protein ANANG_G00026330 [Anguilla anguilla]